MIRAETEIRRRFQSLAGEAFPDDVGVTWHIEAFRSRRDFHCVEARPEPSMVGYPRFRFVYGFRHPAEILELGCYCLDGGRWKLLYTTPNTANEWRSLGFDSSS